MGHFYILFRVIVKTKIVNGRQKYKNSRKNHKKIGRTKLGPAKRERRRIKLGIY